MLRRATLVGRPPAARIARRSRSGAGRPGRGSPPGRLELTRQKLARLLPGVRRRQTDELIDRIKESADKLARDGSSRGDLKIVSRALRELRYAFKVFSPYRQQRKVSVFGSARTPPEDPRYQRAVEFGQAMAEQD